MRITLTTIYLFCAFCVCYAVPKTFYGKNFIISNTVYTDLVTIESGATITVSDGVVLEFKGNVIIPNEAVFIVDPAARVILPSYYISYITPQWFGATGIDPQFEPNVSSQGVQLQNAINCASISNIPLNLGDKKYYTQNSLIANNVEIFGSGIPSIINTTETGWRRDAALTVATYMTGYLQLFSLNGKTNISGAAITSRENITILETDGTANLHDFGIIGYLGNTTQTGLCINSNVYSLKNFSVMGVGGNGIFLPKGLQVSTWENVQCSFNKDYGTFISHEVGKDSPQEYLEFNKCSFSWNQLGGLHLDKFKKRITVKNCNFNGSGWYELYAGPGDKFAINPGLYIKTSPATNATTGTNNTENLQSFSADVLIEENSAEDLLALCKIETMGTLDGVAIRNNTLMRGQAKPVDAKTYLVILKTNGADRYVHSIDISGNSDFSGGSMEPYISNVQNLTGVSVVNPSKEYYQAKTTISSTTPVEFTTFELIRQAYSSYAPDNTKGGATTVWILSGVWNASNAGNTESFLITATKLPNGKYYGNALQIGTAGTGCIIDNSPTVLENGNLLVKFDPYCIGSLQRIDLLGGDLQNITR